MTRPAPIPLDSPASPPTVARGAGVPTRLSNVLFVLAIVAIAFWDLGGRSIWHKDLPRFAVIAREMIDGGDWLVPHQHGQPYMNKPILFIWLVAGPSALFGGDPTVLTLRLPSALALVLMALSTSMWARARTGSVETARWAGLIVATTWLAGEFGRTGRPDMLAAALATWAAALLDRSMLGRGRPSDPWIAGVALGLGLLSKGPIALLVPAALVLVPRPDVALAERARRARPLLALAVAVVVAALWVVPVWIRAGGGFVERLVIDQVKERALGRGNHQEGPFFYVTDLPAFLLLWAPLSIGAAFAFLSRRVRAVLGPATLPLATAAAFVVLSAIPTKDPRYAIVFVPPLSIVAAQALAALCDRVKDARKAARHLAAISVVAIVLGLGSVALMVQWPSAIGWLVPPAAIAVAVGTVRLRETLVRRADSARSLPGPRVLAARWVWLLIAVVACGSAAYWVVFARYLVHSSVRENEAVASVLPAGIPTAIVMHDGLEPDDLYEALRSPRTIREAAAAPSTAAANAAASRLVDVPSRVAAPRLVVVCLEDDIVEVESARGEPAVVLLRRDRRRGRGDEHPPVLVVLRFGT